MKDSDILGVDRCHCGGPVRIEEGQRWDTNNRKYIKCFRVSCWRCPDVGPVKDDRSEAIDAWNAMQTEEKHEVP